MKLKINLLDPKTSMLQNREIEIDENDKFFAYSYSLAVLPLKKKATEMNIKDGKKRGYLEIKYLVLTRSGEYNEVNSKIGYVTDANGKRKFLKQTMELNIDNALYAIILENMLKNTTKGSKRARENMQSKYEEILGYVKDNYENGKMYDGFRGFEEKRGRRVIPKVVFDEEFYKSPDPKKTFLNVNVNKVSR